MSIATPLVSERIAERWFTLPNLFYLAPIPLLATVAAVLCWRALHTEQEIAPFLLSVALFLLGYGTFRSLVEFVRLPDDHIGYLAFGWLTMGHVLTIPMVIAGCILMWLAYRQPQTAAPTTT